MRIRVHYVLLLPTALLLAACAGGNAQQPESTASAPGAQRISDDAYVNAVKVLPGNVAPLVDHDVQGVHWLNDTKFWFVDHDANGDHYEVMDASGKGGPAFDQEKLAAALSRVTNSTVSASALGIREFAERDDGKLFVTLGARDSDEHYVCDLSGAGQCVTWASTLEHKPGDQIGQAVAAPNGKYEVFERDWNLWLRDLDTGKETNLTHDGVKDYGYATGNAGYQHDRGAIVRWSSNSELVATFRQDQREVGDMYIIHAGLGHPTLTAWKFPYATDKDVFMIQPVVINIKTGKMVRLKMEPEQRLSSECDLLTCDSGTRNVWSDVKWGPDGKTLAFVSSSRDQQHEWYRVADARTGDVHDIFQYVEKQWYESGNFGVNWQYLPETDQAIWVTEENDWLNLYLYSLKTGKELHPITAGAGDVDRVLRLDRETRTLWYVGTGRTPDVNPYFEQLFTVNIDTGKTTLLTPEDADHNITMSPNGDYFVDSYSTPTKPPVTVLRSSLTGQVIATVARTNIDRLTAIGWAPPELIKVKGRDGKTDLYGLMFKPADFDPDKKYPIIDYVYPGPWIGSVSTFSWRPSLVQHQSLANLGFIVVAIDGMGTPWRSASFHHYYYGNMGDATIPDQIAGIKDLAKRSPWIDLRRVGIWGHSAGGFTTVEAILTYPDFFKVGWAESGDYDQRNYEYEWTNKHEGLFVDGGNGKSNYDNLEAELKAKNLKGHLMLVDGLADTNVPPSNTFLLVNALISSNKNFDMIFLPDANHAYGDYSPYVDRRRWDFFVTYLAGKSPPHEFKIPDRAVVERLPN